MLHEQSAYANGIRIDYLIPKLYLSALVGFGLVLFTASYYKKWLLLLAWLALLGFALRFNWFGAELLLTAGIAWSVTQLPNSILQKSWIGWGIAGMLAFQSLVALGQFLLQKPLFGYWFLGEINLLRFAGIATQIFAGKEFILPSGTTAHPNVLAGIMVIGSALLWQRRATVPRWLVFSTLAIALTSLILTFSLSAWLAAGFALAFFLAKNRLDYVQKKLLLAGVWSLIVVIPLTLAQLEQVSTNPSLVRRAALNEIAYKQFIAHPLWGTGLNTFTSELAQTNENKVLERFIQPTHHVPLLILAETGLIGVLGVLGILIWLQRKNFVTDELLLASCVVVPLLSLDHYLYTLESGRLAVVVLLLMVLVTESEKELESA